MTSADFYAILTVLIQLIQLIRVTQSGGAGNGNVIYDFRGRGGSRYYCGVRGGAEPLAVAARNDSGGAIERGNAYVIRNTVADLRRRTAGGRVAGGDGADDCGQVNF